MHRASSLATVFVAWLFVIQSSPTRGDNAVARVRRHEPRMSYLDNGVIRFGVDLNLGGSITYLSRSGSNQNLINSHDFGRQVQMSYYSGPVPFDVPGKEPKPEWRFIGWNPIQVGDAFGNASKLLEQRNDGRSIYVKCVPMHWPLDDVPGECTYECWFELDGPAVRARCRINNDRPDRRQYPARNQELPAVYTNGPWYRLMTYSGDRPFTNEKLTRIQKPKGAAGMWSRWTATESWAALVDDHDFGLGVWHPGVRDFGGGFAGRPGAGGPADDPTGYIAPSPRLIIDWNIQHEYRYDLIVGTLPDIRAYVYAHADRPHLPDYQFRDDRQGWTYTNATDTGWPIRGELHVLLDQNDPQLHGPVGVWNAADARALVIEAASHTSHDDAQLFWRRLDEAGFTETNSIRFSLNSDGAFHTYHVNLANNPDWKGAVTQIRLDPVSMGGPGEWIRIKSIGFER
jgi:hypothetical protein